jgi:hypothetical protein
VKNLDESSDSDATKDSMNSAYIQAVSVNNLVQKVSIQHRKQFKSIEEADD